MYELVVLVGKLAGKKLLLPQDRDIAVGRDETCQIQLNSALISRRHCVLKHTHEGIWVRDFESQNGTYVNDVVITGDTMMVPGDVLRIGAIVFEVDVYHPEEVEESPQVAKPATPVKAAMAPPPVAPAVAIATATATATATAPTATAAATAKRRRSTVSDNEIADWLSDSNPGAATGDTAIIQVARTAAAAPPAPPAKLGAVPAPAAAPAVKKFRSVKEEAADIIRRHWAKQRGDAPDDSALS